MLFGAIPFSMICMIVISPVVDCLLCPALDWAQRALHVKPTIITSVIYANKIGGASLAAEPVGHMMGVPAGVQYSDMLTLISSLRAFSGGADTFSK